MTPNHAFNQVRRYGLYKANARDCGPVNLVSSGVAQSAGQQSMNKTDVLTFIRSHRWRLLPQRQRRWRLMQQSLALP